MKDCKVVLSLDGFMKFSIIIPVYNVAPYLRECLDSVCAQTFAEWEAICVDDGSTDESGKILDEYAGRDRRFRVIHQKNAGVSAARNAAIDVAGGEWLMFLDADDMIVPDALQFLAQLADNPLLKTVRSIAFGFGFVPRETSFFKSGDGFSLRYNAEADRSTAATFFRSAWSLIFRREEVGSLRFPNYKYNEDAIFVMDFLTRGKGWAVTDAKLYCYRVRKGSVVHQQMSKEIVSKIFDSENELIDLAIRGLRTSPGSDYSELFNALHRRNFWTYERAYFKLNSTDRKELFPRWLAIQKRFCELYRVPSKRRFFVVLCGLAGTAFWVKVMLEASSWLSRAGGTKKC